MYFHKLIHQPFDDKHRLSSHEKLSFTLTNITCVIQGTSQTGSENNFPSPLTSVHIFSVLRSHGVHRKGRDLGTLFLGQNPQFPGISINFKVLKNYLFPPVFNLNAKLSYSSPGCKSSSTLILHLQ